MDAAPLAETGGVPRGTPAVRFGLRKRRRSSGRCASRDLVRNHTAVLADGLRRFAARAIYGNHVFGGCVTASTAAGRPVRLAIARVRGVWPLASPPPCGVLVGLHARAPDLS